MVRQYVPRTGRVMAVLGSGGHTTEMTYLLKTLDPDIYTPVIYVLANNDYFSMSQIKPKSIDTVVRLPRARNVGQSFFTAIFTFIYAFIIALIVVWRQKPQLLLMNGPGTCVPIVMAFCLLRYLPFTDMNHYWNRSLYVESIARVCSPSLAARFCYPFADQIVYQWNVKDFNKRWPRMRCVGFLYCFDDLDFNQKPRPRPNLVDERIQAVVHRSVFKRGDQEEIRRWFEIMFSEAKLKKRSRSLNQKRSISTPDDELPVQEPEEEEEAAVIRETRRNKYYSQ